LDGALSKGGGAALNGNPNPNCPNNADGDESPHWRGPFVSQVVIESTGTESGLQCIEGIESM
jgi:hypothetical protein